MNLYLTVCNSAINFLDLLGTKFVDEKDLTCPLAEKLFDLHAELAEQAIRSFGGLSSLRNKLALRIDISERIIEGSARLLAIATIAYVVEQYSAITAMRPEVIGAETIYADAAAAAAFNQTMGEALTLSKRGLVASTVWSVALSAFSVDAGGLLTRFSKKIIPEDDLAAIDQKLDDLEKSWQYDQKHARYYRDWLEANSSCCD